MLELFFSFGDLEKDLKDLRVSIKNAQKEVDYQKANPSGEIDDGFLVIMVDFTASMSDSFTQLEGMVAEMKERVRSSAYSVP